MQPTLRQRLFRTKSPQDLVDEAGYESEMHGMKKTLTAFDLVAFGVGATIGTGIFAMTGTAAAGQVATGAIKWIDTPIVNFILNEGLGRQGAGPAIVISFIIAAFACGLAALCYAELASMIPVSGSAYTFAYAALGELIAWIIGWDLILEYAVGNIAIAVSWADYFMQLTHGLFHLQFPLWLTSDINTATSRLAQIKADPSIAQMYSDTHLPILFGHPFAINVPAFSIVAAVTWLLVVGIKESAWVNTAAVWIKVAIVIFFIVYGFGFVQPANWVPFAPSGLAGIMGGAAIVFFAFIGFDAISSTAEETKNPQRDMPIGMIGTLVLCTILYVLVSLVLTGILPYMKYLGDAAPVATALKSVGNPWAHILVSAGALAGMTSVLLVFQLGQPRIFMAMARDRLLPSFFSKLHPKYRTPYVSTLITGGIVAVSAFVLDIGEAANLCNIGTLAAFILVCGGVIMLRAKHPNQHRPFRCPGSPFVPALGMISCFILMLSLPVLTWIRFVVWMAAGMIIYVFYGMKNQDKHTV